MFPRPDFSDDWPVISIMSRPSPGGASGAFLGIDCNSKQWWVKPLNNGLWEQTIVTDYIVGKLGILIGASVCDVAVVVINEDLEDQVFRPASGLKLQAGLAHGSRHLEDAIEKRSNLLHRDRDDNSRRHAGLFALYDWCWGDDDQWLHCGSQDMATFSHDHGLYLPRRQGERGWTVDALEENRETPHMPKWDRTGLDENEIARITTRFRNMSPAEIEEILCTVPSSWPVSDNELTALRNFLICRLGPCADRLDNVLEGRR